MAAAAVACCVPAESFAQRNPLTSVEQSCKRSFQGRYIPDPTNKGRDVMMSSLCPSADALDRVDPVVDEVFGLVVDNIPLPDGNAKTIVQATLFQLQHCPKEASNIQEGEIRVCGLRPIYLAIDDYGDELKETIGEHLQTIDALVDAAQQIVNDAAEEALEIAEGQAEYAKQLAEDGVDTAGEVVGSVPGLAEEVIGNATGQVAAIIAAAEGQAEALFNEAESIASELPDQVGQEVAAVIDAAEDQAEFTFGVVEATGALIFAQAEQTIEEGVGTAGGAIATVQDLIDSLPVYGAEEEYNSALDQVFFAVDQFVLSRLDPERPADYAVIVTFEGMENISRAGGGYLGLVEPGGLVEAPAALEVTYEVLDATAEAAITIGNAFIDSGGLQDIMDDILRRLEPGFQVVDELVCTLDGGCE